LSKELAKRAGHVRFIFACVADEHVPHNKSTNEGKNSQGEKFTTIVLAPAVSERHEDSRASTGLAI
jgi:hypothetical protein